MKTVLFFLLCFFIFGTVYGERYNFEVALQGLPGQNEANMVRDHEGLLWFHAYGSLYSYDAYEVKYYTPGPNSISESGANSIQVDREGNIWILTQNSGLTRYDKSEDSFTHFMHDSTDENTIIWNKSDAFNPNRLAVTKNNELLIGTFGGFDIYDIDSDKFTHFTHDPDKNSISSNRINAVIEGNDGIIWVGTADKGLNSYNRKTDKWRSYRHNPNNKNSICNDEIWSLMEDHDGELWIGTRASGVTRFNKKRDTFSHYRRSSSDTTTIGENMIIYMYEDSRGIIWFTHYMSKERGLSTYNKATDKFNHYSAGTEGSSLSSNNINSVFEDPVTKIIWIINTHNGVVDKIDPRSIYFDTYTPQSSANRRLLTASTLKLLEISDGKIWVSSGGGGISVIDRENDTMYTFPFDSFDKEGIINQQIFGMCEDQEGNFWIVEYRGALLKLNYDGEKITLLKSYVHDPENPNSPLTNDFYGRSLFVDSRDPDLLWYCSSEGVTKFRISTETFTHYTHDPESDNSINEGTVWAINEDSSGNIWVSVYGGGFSIINKESGKISNYYPDLNNPFGMHVDQNSGVFFDSFGNTWIFGYKNGMDKFDIKTGIFTHFNKSTGFPAVGISNEIQEDREGNLWIASANSGIIKFDIKTESVEAVYNKVDGILSNTIWATYQTADGTLWFSGDKGITSFHPDDLRANPYIPPVALTEITQAGVKMDLKTTPERVREIKLDWQSNFFEFQFAGLNYTNPEKNEFAYMLEGLDNEWYYSGNNPFGRYSGLQGGNYTLRLKASNNDGVWNEEGISIALNVNSPFWRTWWFYSLVSILMAGIITLFFRYQLNINSERIKLKSMESAKEAAESATISAESANKAKSDFLANMSHEIRTPLNAIIGFSEILKNKVIPQNLERINSINLSGKSLLNLINDILDLSKVEAGKLELQYGPVSLNSIFQEMDTIFKEKMTLKGLEFTRYLPDKFPKALILDETRIRQILINLIGNAVKFTDNGYIKVTAEYSDAALTISVEDTGIGIPENQQDHIFGTFNQLKDQDQRKYHGTGLGLAISKRFVEMMGGDIKIESTEGEGTTFYITLKNIELTSEALVLKDKFDLNYDSIKFDKFILLVADDYRYNREVVKGYLEGIDVEVLEAENGLQVLEIMNTQKPDLVLLDIKMPELDGYDVIERVKSDPNLRTIPIIAVTASAMKKEEDALKRDCSGYLPKPLLKNDFFHELMRHLKYEKIETEEASESTGKTHHMKAEIISFIETKKDFIQTLEDKMSIDSIEDFAKVVIDLGNTYGEPAFKRLGVNLSEACRQFNIPVIKEILHSFYEL